MQDIDDLDLEPVTFLVEAEIAARQAFDARIAREPGFSALARKRVSRYLDNPIWRGLVELHLNGATSFEHGLMLRGAGLLRPARFFVLAGDLAGRELDCVEFTDLGLEQLHGTLSFKGADDPCREAIYRAVSSYLVIDRGNGIVATRSALEVALEIDDRDLLSRACSLVSGCPMALPPPARSKGATEEDWMEMAEFFSNGDDDRRGAAIIDLAALDGMSERA
ncbi:hypothetical protein C8J30_110123 [Rhodobacter viridis]|uniref:Uncharacterized protein n=2 Tax=Rhodobacter viridis TaxID=1054202 RepID=A0A318UAW9_9RHOB|nr:hypothetical protein C8J30_110123 [Rhodobacter viridis]